MPIIINHHSLGDALGQGLEAYGQGKLMHERLATEKLRREILQAQIELQKESAAREKSLFERQTAEFDRQRAQSEADKEAGGAALDLMRGTVAPERPEGMSGPLPLEVSDPDHAQALQRIQALMPRLSPKAQELLLNETQSTLRRDAINKGARNFSTEVRHNAALGSYGEQGAQQAIQAADMLDQLAASGLDDEQTYKALLETHRLLGGVQKDQAELRSKQMSRQSLSEGIMQQAATLPGGPLNPQFYKLSQLAAYAGGGAYDKDPTEAIEAAQGIAQGWEPYTNPKNGKAMYLPPQALAEMQERDQQLFQAKILLQAAQAQHATALSEAARDRIRTPEERAKQLELTDSQIAANKARANGKATSGPGLSYKDALKQATSEVDWRKGITELDKFSQRVKDLMEGKIELPGQSTGNADQEAAKERAKALYAEGKDAEADQVLRDAGLDPDG